MSNARHLFCYCSKPSYRAGSTIDCHIASSSGRVRTTISRSGLTEEVVWTSGDQTIDPIVTLEADVAASGCNWPVSISIPSSPEWRSGGYIIRIIDPGDPELTCEGFFVLRPAKRLSSCLLIVTTSTYQAYNDFGGGNTYATGGTSYSGGLPVVAWERPLPAGFVTKPVDFVRIANTDDSDETIPFVAWALERGLTIWSGGTGWSNYELPFSAWAERRGYHVDYASSHDLHRDRTLLEGYDLVLSVGHDEYWSWEMRDNLEGFIAAGGNVCFFSGNTAFWQVRFDEDLRMSAYKSKWRDDPEYRGGDPARTTGLWSNPVTMRPENAMTGVSFTTGGYARVAGASPGGSGGFVIYKPEHWIFEGTGLRYGDVLGAAFSLVGYEVDGCRFEFQKGRPVPTGADGTPENFEILGLAAAQLLTSELAPNFYPPGTMSDFEVVADQCAGDGSPFDKGDFAFGHATMGIYKSGGTVFTSASTEWAVGLAAGDETISTITANLVERLGRITARD